MFSLNYLEHSENSALYEIPPGKPNPKEPCMVGIDSRSRVVKGPIKGKESWYYTFNYIRKRIGKNSCEELKNERDIEKRCSQRRKACVLYLDSFPTIVYQIDTDKVRNWLIILDYVAVEDMIKHWDILKKEFEKPEVLEGGPSLLLSLQEFLKERKDKNLYEFFVRKVYETFNSINADFLTSFGIEPEKMYQKEITDQEYPERKAWNKLTRIDKIGILDFFVRKVSAEKYGLQVASWNPTKKIEELTYELEQHGPLYIGGAFGKHVYIDEPFKMKNKIGGRDIYSWKPGASRNAVVFSAHAVLLIGAKKAQDKSYVFFIDPEDRSDPKDIESQKIYTISYQNLISHICDLHGRIRTNSSANIGYAYHGNFRPSTQNDELECPISLAPFHHPRILLEDGFTYEKIHIEEHLNLRPNNSPFLGNLGKVTLRPNYALTRALICPITQKPFQEAYYCVEDGYTYEREAIVKYVEEKKKGLSEKNRTIQSPASGVLLKSVTLYPNKILFKVEIPKKQIRINLPFE